MRLQDSKLAAKARKVKATASQVESQADSIPYSTVSTQTNSLPLSSGSTSMSRKRIAPDLLPLAPDERRTKRTKKPPSPPPEPKTPDQSTEPANPNYTDGTDTSLATNVSGVTTESKDEESTKWLLSTFITNTLTILGAEFRTITWQHSPYRLELMHTYKLVISR
jgi:hypothetical protein